MQTVICDFRLKLDLMNGLKTTEDGGKNALVVKTFILSVEFNMFRESDANQTKVQDKNRSRLNRFEFFLSY